MFYLKKYFGMKNSGNVVFSSCHDRKSVYDLRYNDNNVLKPLLIFCHGFKGFKDWGHFNLIADKFAQAELIVLKFNFTFNGGNDQEVIDFPDLNAFSENNYLKEVQDIHHMVALCENGEIPLTNWNGDIFLLGHSRGGGMVTIAGAQNEKVSKVISWAGISDCISRLPAEKDLINWKEKEVRYIANGRTKQEMPMKYQFVEELMKNKELLSIEKACKTMVKPHLVIHGTRDEAVSYENARQINAWSTQSILREIKEANHVFGGKHPWDDSILPEHTINAIEKTLEFLN